MAAIQGKTKTISAQELHALLLAEGEVAVLDVREEWPFSKRHLLVASNAPVGRIELLIGNLIPRLDALIVLCDDNNEFTDLAALRIGRMGYANVKILQGGIGAWEAAGYSVFDGVHVPSKAFGEMISETLHTPSVSATELHQMLASDAPPFLIDCRPKIEFASWRLPGAIDLPGVELAYRVLETGIQKGRKLVVNCAGRTRSIIGTQTLIDLGLAADVAGLKNGLMGWRLAGFESDLGTLGYASEESAAVRAITLPEISPASLAVVAEAVERVAKRTGVSVMDWNDLEALRRTPNRTLYLLDVRTPEEFAAGHHRDAASAPGGQLIQETDRYAGVRNAILVLIDDTGVRAKLTASWLKRLGWRDVYALPDILDRPDLAGGPQSPLIQPDPGKPAWIDADALKADLDRGEISVLDLSLSSAHLAGHIPGAYFATRTGLRDQVRGLPGKAGLVLVSEDGELAALAASDEIDWGGRTVRVLRGGMKAWSKAGLPLETGMPKKLAEIDDRWLQPERHPGGMPGFMKDYLTWEVGLVERVLHDGTVRYAQSLIKEIN